MSYLEIYNENIRDLLNPASGFLELREDTSRNRNIQVTGLSEVMVVSIDEVMGLLHQGNRQRTVEPTGVNKTSSRSHALLSVTVCKASRTATAVRQGRLFMIDLAGSERASHTKVRVRLWTREPPLSPLVTPLRGRKDVSRHQLNLI